MNQNFELLAIGNAIVDILCHADDDFFVAELKNGMQRNSMTLIEPERAQYLYEQMKNPIEMSGGSAANTMACYAALGGKGAYIGKVADDHFGKVFARDMNQNNIYFNTPPLFVGPATAQCLIFVEENAHRSMNTYLGASVLFDEGDVDEDLVARSGITYLEGYLFDRDTAKGAFIKAAELAHKYQRKLALTLSDTFCVHRHRDDFKHLIENHIDILFANHIELLALYETDDLDEAMKKVAPHCDIAAVTQGEHGSHILARGEHIQIPAHPNVTLVDTTGAGDSYAAGFLYGVTHNFSLRESGRLGARVAAEIISQMGPRPKRSFEDFLPDVA